MIKGTYFLRYLKLCLFGFLISCFMVLGNSASAYQLSDLNFYKEIDLGVSYQLNSYSASNIFTVSPEIDFYSKVDDTIFNKSFTVGTKLTIGSNTNISYRSIGWLDGKLYGLSFYAPTNNVSRYKSEGFFQKVCKIPSTTFTGVLAGCSENNNNFTDISALYSGGNVWKKAYVFGDLYNTNNDLYYCFDNGSYTYCVKINAGQYNNLTGSLGYNNYTVQGLLSVPFTNSNFLGYDVEIKYDPNFTTNQNILDYYESIYNWDRDLCYLGTDYLGTDYTGDYQNLGGLTIFEGYSRLYTGTNVSDPYGLVGNTSTYYAGAWLNTIMNNYNTYMNKRQDYTELSCNNCLHYSYWGNNGLYSIDRGYNFDPFAGRPSVEFGYSAKAVNRYNQVLSAGGEIAIYCYALFKNPNDEYDGVFPEWLKNNINNYNIVKENKSTDWQNTEYSVPSGSGFLSTGSTDFGSGAKEFYARITEKLNSTGFNVMGAIPDYILGFLVLILLFRFLKK